MGHSSSWYTVTPSILGLLLVLAGFVYQHIEIAKLTNTVTTLQASVAHLATSTAPNTISTQTPASQVTEKSQTQALQDAVAAVTPAVVSIVESREVPKLLMTYENPFGRDPVFRSFGIRVPTYRQVGTTTQQVGAGTGFIVRSTGYIVTNKHVVADIDGTYTVLLADGAQKPATVVWRSTDKDLAVIKIAGTGYPSIPLGDSSSLHLAESVFAVGNALGEYSNSVSVGVISGLNRTITASNNHGIVETLEGVIQTDAAINPGNSGGPLVNLDGHAVGVNVAMVRGSQNIGFSLPIHEVKLALTSLGI